MPQDRHAMRTVILHNHLFKNAGTSVDLILRQNFGDAWLTAEFPMPAGGNTDAVVTWIAGNPQAVAFSSHTMIGPLPELKGTRIFPIVLLRDPVERIASAYRFERTQVADTQGARLAKAHGFAGYVDARLSTTGDRQCRNFQVHRLATLLAPERGTELERACLALQLVSQTGVVGFVPEFDRAMRRLSALIVPHHPTFRWRPVNANATAGGSEHSISPDMRTLLEETNQDDLALLRFARTLSVQAPTGAPRDQLAGIS